MKISVALGNVMVTKLFNDNWDNVSPHIAGAESPTRSKQHSMRMYVTQYKPRFVCVDCTLVFESMSSVWFTWLAYNFR